MTTVLLVDLEGGPHQKLGELGVSAVAVSAVDLRHHLDDDHVGVVVLEGRNPDAAVASVQEVHRAAPLVQVVVLVSDETEAEVRRRVRFATDVPSDLELLPVHGAELSEQLLGLARAAGSRRAHERVLAGIRARESSRPQAAPLIRASLGAMLEQAPLGVVVADRALQILACNPSARRLLQLAGDVTGSPLSDLFPDHRFVERLVAAATATDAADPWPEEATVGRGGTHLDVSVALTQLDDGRDVVMLLAGDATERRQAELARDALSDQVAMIGRISEALIGTEDPEDALHRIAEQVVPTLADWVSMQLYDERGATRQVVARHSDPQLAELTALVQRDLPGGTSEESPSRRLAAGSPPILLGHITDEMLARFVPDPATRQKLQTIGVDSAIAVPFEGRTTRVGSMVLINRAPTPPLDEQELAVAVEVGRRVGIALETLHLYSQQTALAEALQRSMLTDPPDPPHAEIAVRYRPAAHEAQVGGDWYDAYLQPDGSIVLSIGDVVGHDYRAAAAMGQLRGLLRGIGYGRGRGPAAMMRSLDMAIEGLLPGTTATAVVAKIPPPDGGAADGTRLLTWSNAGHPPPLLVPRGAEPTVLEVEEADLILGVVPDYPRRELEADLMAGDTLVLYSDGLIERRGQDFDDGLTQLRRALTDCAALPLEELCDHLLERLVPGAQDDDVAIVAVRLR